MIIELSPEIKLQKLKCQRCQHEWVPRKTKIRSCPGCHSPWWDTPKKKRKKK